jgi:gamma-tubulin complex component 2
MIEVTSKTFRENCAISSIVKLQGMEWEDWCREKDEHVLFSLLDSNEDILSMTMLGASAGLGVDRSRATSHMSAINKAHATGKYWRAIHCCHEGDGGGGSAAPFTLATAQGLLKKKEDVEVDEHAVVLLNPLKLSRSINQAYHEASDTFLGILLDKYDLLSSLRFMKKYFLLDQGDFFVDFLDHAEDELQNELPSVLQGRVQNWLSTSIARTSDSSRLSSSLRCSFQNKSLRDTLDDLGRRDNKRKSSKKNTRPKTLMGFEAITFELKSVPFPTSIVLSTRQLRIYQLLCRLIFFAKYAERQLVGMWSDHQLLRTMTSLRSACSPTFSLRRRMLHFIQNLVYYLKFDVIEPAWRELESKLAATKEYCRSGRAKSNRAHTNTGHADTGQSFPRTVDDLVHEHDQFLIRIAQQCLITNYDLIDRASKIMTTCLLFSTQIKRFIETTKVHDLHEKTRQERSQLRYAKRGSKDDDREASYRANRRSRVQRCSDGIRRELCTDTYRHMITRFDEVFSAHLSEFMRNLNSDFGQKNNAHLANLSMQLDYNGFLSSSIFAKE